MSVDARLTAVDGEDALPHNALMRDRFRSALCLAIIVGTVLACGQCSRSLSRSSDSYRRSHDYPSLSVIVGALRLGQPRAEVEKLLGLPDYSPTSGLFYYSSDRRTEGGTTVGLIVEYRTTDPRTGETRETGKLESFALGPIAE